MSIIAFPKTEEIQVELDLETIEKLGELVERSGTTVDLYLNEALEIYLAEFAVGDSLLEHLKTLKKTAGRATNRAIHRWVELIDTRLDHIEKADERRLDL